MELDDRIRSLYRDARLALLQFDMHVPTRSINLTALPRRIYDSWIELRDESGLTKSEVTALQKKKKDKSSRGIQENGLCEVIGSQRFNIRLAYPEKADEHGIWDAYVFRYLAHELAHVWWFMETDLGREEQTKLARYELAKDSVQEELKRFRFALPEVGLPDKLASYKSYEDFAMRYTQRLEAYNRLWIGKKDLDKLLLCSQMRTDLDKAARELASASRSLPRIQPELREGWAEYVSVHMMEWYYARQGIESLDPLPEGTESYGRVLQQLELWKRPTIQPDRMGLFTGVERVNNREYTSGLERFNRFNSFKEAKEFVITARTDDELPL